MQAAFGMFVPEKYTYDNYGNPIKYRNNTLEWECGTFLQKYGNIEYTYDVKQACKESRRRQGCRE